MLNPENRPTLRILPDGRKVPTIEGLKYTEEEKARRSRILAGKAHGREATLKKSVVWNLVKPLYLRDGLVVEISWITGFDKFQIRRAINRDKRPVWHTVVPMVYDGESKSPVERQLETKELINTPRTLDDDCSILFAREILRRGLISSDDSSWRELLDLYKSRKRLLPPRLYDRLRLEVFLKARKMISSGDRELFNQYLEIGKNVDNNWFGRSLVEEQRFITSVFAPTTRKPRRTTWTDDPNLPRVTPADVARSFSFTRHN